MAVGGSGSRPGSANGNLVIRGDIGFFTTLRVTELRVPELRVPELNSCGKKICLLVPKL